MVSIVFIAQRVIQSSVEGGAQKSVDRVSCHSELYGCEHGDECWFCLASFVSLVSIAAKQIVGVSMTRRSPLSSILVRLCL
jgi:hypothetical protein